MAESDIAPLEDSQTPDPAAVEPQVDAPSNDAPETPSPLPAQGVDAVTEADKASAFLPANGTCKPESAAVKCQRDLLLGDMPII